MKTIIAFISLLLIAFTATAQHQIITNNNDTIEAQILFKNDSVFHYKNIERHNIEMNISVFHVKKLIAIGEDSFYNTYTNFTQAQIDETFKNEQNLKPKYRSPDFTITEVITLDSTQKSEYLFNKAQKFVALNFKNSQRVIQLADRISGTIICKGTMSCYADRGFLGIIQAGFMHYTITILIKNSKYKLDVNQIKYSPSTSSCYGSYSITDLDSPCGIWGSDWEKIKENYAIEMDAFMNEFKAEMAKPITEEW